MNDWFFAVDGVQYGPVAEDVLRGYVAEGRVRGTDAVWRDGMPEWIAAEKALAVEAPFFAVGIRKLVILSILTLGVYPVLWFYLHWHTIKAREGSRIWPLPRTIFSILYIHPLMRRIEQYAAARQFLLVYPKAAITALFIVTSFAGNAKAPWFLLGAGIVIPVVMVQRQVNALHKAIGVTEDPNERMTRWNWPFLVAGAILLLLLLISLFFPEA